MKPIRIGVVGCGAIAQVHHLPNLMMLDQEFEVAGLCDISPTLARTIAEDYGVAFHTSDYRELLAADLEAVLLCHSDPKTEAALAAFEAGKHVLIEKPLCFSLADIDAVTAAVQASGKVGMAAYMKVYDPAYEIAWREVERMSSIRFVQINHLHTGNEFHLRHLRLKRFDDRPAVPGGTVGDIARDVLGDGVPAAAASAFRTVAGSMIHDIYGLRLMIGAAPTGGQHRDLEPGPRHQHGAGLRERSALRRLLGFAAGAVELHRDSGGLCRGPQGDGQLSQRLRPGNPFPGGRSRRGRGRPDFLQGAGGGMG